MTKEELRQEAREQANIYVEDRYDENGLWTSDYVRFVEGYLASAEPREERIAELEAQIEGMKCCENCDNWNWKHNKCKKKLKGDCFKASKWQLRR